MVVAARARGNKFFFHIFDASRIVCLFIKHLERFISSFFLKWWLSILNTLEHVLNKQVMLKVVYSCINGNYYKVFMGHNSIHKVATKNNFSH